MVIDVLKKTVDPFVLIEEQSQGYIRYRYIDTEGKILRRWEVFGECIHLGNCQIGSVTNDGRAIDSQEELERLRREEPEALIWPLDSPVTPEFHGCCQFSFNELEV